MRCVQLRTPVLSTDTASTKVRKSREPKTPRARAGDTGSSLVKSEAPLPRCRFPPPDVCAASSQAVGLNRSSPGDTSAALPVEEPDEQSESDWASASSRSPPGATRLKTYKLSNIQCSPKTRLTTPQVRATSEEKGHMAAMAAEELQSGSGQRAKPQERHAQTMAVTSNAQGLRMEGWGFFPQSHASSRMRGRLAQSLRCGRRQARSKRNKRRPQRMPRADSKRCMLRPMLVSQL
mmetsp:Transcript_42887/g.124009  ORF Transcript_42887/g.124009 Transcript_42887/m.124009 type:complete len:235 (+) Transcript_42887:169-873(+)